jgi:hypothetical protein
MVRAIAGGRERVQALEANLLDQDKDKIRSERIRQL